MVAVIRVTGDAKLPPNGSDTLINAQVLFRFSPRRSPRPPPTARRPAADDVDARGAITEVRVARTSSSAVPGGNGRLRRTLTWELTLQRDLAERRRPDRRPPPAPAADPGQLVADLRRPQGPVPLPPPARDAPQDRPRPRQRREPPAPRRAAGTLEGRVITFVLQDKTGDPEKDRNIRDPEFHKKDLNENWARNRRDVLHGPSGWLPEADWTPYRMKVYRIEAAEKPSGAAARDVPRIFLDHYLILFSQNESLAVDAITGQDPPTPFRKQVEEILKTFSLGPSGGPAG